MIPEIEAKAIIMADIPHKGAVTHHHDQLIAWVNFSTKNTRNNKPIKVIPPLELELFDDIL